MSISYVIPTLNSASTLDMTLLSLRSQKDINVKVIVVDSGSTDGTLDVCKRWNIKTLYAEPGNMYRAINIGLRECDTEWLGYINSDDWLYSDSLTRLITHGNASNADIVYGICDFTDVHGRFMYSFTPPKCNQLISMSKTGVLGIAQQTTIFRNRLYQRLKGFNEEYYFAADRDFYMRALQSNAIFTFLPGSSVACFRLHRNQLSQKKSELMRVESKKINTTLFKSPSYYDWAIRMQWHLSNLPHYLLRFFRQSMLSGEITVTKSMHGGTHLETQSKAF
ncbi:glycosyl transferase family 2 [Gloeocapsa sp. PCC 7428]|nr:glycosyl transferase family 2 [Gloeocapsa sp. PCC 7428]